jgi:hypothetical protein
MLALHEPLGVTCAASLPARATQVQPSGSPGWQAGVHSCLIKLAGGFARRALAGAVPVVVGEDRQRFDAAENRKPRHNRGRPGRPGGPEAFRHCVERRFQSFGNMQAAEHVLVEAEADNPRRASERPGLSTLRPSRSRYVREIAPVGAEVTGSAMIATMQPSFRP